MLLADSEVEKSPAMDPRPLYDASLDGVAKVDLLC